MGWIGAARSPRSNFLRILRRRHRFLTLEEARFVGRKIRGHSRGVPIEVFYSQIHHEVCICAMGESLDLRIYNKRYNFPPLDEEQKLEIGDRLFDRRFQTYGNQTLALAVLNRSTRAQLKGVQETGGLMQIQGGAVLVASSQFELERLEAKISMGISAAASVALLLRDRLARITEAPEAQILQEAQDEDLPVRRKKLLYLMRSPQAPYAKDAARFVQAQESDPGLLLGAALVDKEPEAIRQAALTCLEHAQHTELTASAIADDQRRAALALYKLGAPEAERALLQMLKLAPDQQKEEIIRRLERLGTVLSIPALSQLSGGSAHKKLAARAIFAIQARALGAGDGQLSLAEPEEEGQLSLSQSPGGLSPVEEQGERPEPEQPALGSTLLRRVEKPTSEDGVHAKSGCIGRSGVDAAASVRGPKL